ncbi:MAG TPA: hypothetical protein GXZ90_02890 [Clostridiales bacterium]|nr:hypothetical protein [Clostridiales bacterium]
MTQKQIQYIKDNNLFGLNDVLTEKESWDDLELIKSEIVTNIANTVQYYWIDKDDYSKNRALLDYIQENEADIILSGVNDLEKYNVDNYVDSMMLLAKDILEVKIMK